MTKTTWNAFLLKHAPSGLFQSWEWGEVEKRLGHKVWRLNWPGAIAQVVKVEARRGTFLHVRHGPIVTDNWGQVVKDLTDLARKEGAWFLRISPQIQTLPVKGFRPAPIHAMDAEVCWVLDLNQPEDIILSNMRKTTRYEIRHAKEVKIEQTNDIKRFLTLYSLTSKRQNFVEHKGIQEEFDCLDARCYVASFNGKDIAAAIIVDFGNQSIYHHGASIPTKIPASYVLQWHAIQEAKKRGKKIYNFWGIAPDDSKNHPWRGLTAFKMGFGGRRVSSLHAQDLPLSPRYLLTRTVEGIRKKVKGY